MNKQRKKEWFYDDEFWRELYPFMFSEQRRRRSRCTIRQVLALTKPPGKAVLDIGCGPGLNFPEKPRPRKCRSAYDGRNADLAYGKSKCGESSAFGARLVGEVPGNPGHCGRKLISLRTI
jgi:ubiquinone/menaquinone biosynthesis C-methylase UbiE